VLSQKQTAISAVKKALQKSKKTVVWILKIILPVSLFVSFLQYWGVIELISAALTPLFIFLGLPGEAAIVFISIIFLTLYAPIAIIATLSLSLREITILALMCLISHNLIVETAVQSKTGSSAWFIALLRISSSIVVALCLNWLLPADMGRALLSGQTVEVPTSVMEVLLNWVKMACNITIKLIIIVTLLMFLQSFLKEFHWLDKLSKPFAPIMNLLGLDSQSSFLWIVAQIVGLTYGSAVLLEEVNEHALPQRQVNLLNYHIAVNHSLLEDTFLFVAIGVPILWILIPRLIVALIIVWTMRAFYYFHRK
jgi:hypothetical protein